MTEPRPRKRPRKPRWLSARQQNTWRAYLAGASRIENYLNDDLRRRGLDMSEYEVLVCLSEAPGRTMRMSELAANSRQSRSRLTHTANRMERQGYLVRSASVDDKRGVLAHLTDSGFALIESAAPAHVEAVRRIFVDAVDPKDFDAIGRAMRAVLAVAD